MGYWFAEAGIFAWLKGNGAPGSLGISASAGGAGIWGEQKPDSGEDWEVESINIIGPMISLGLTYRFGVK